MKAQLNPMSMERERMLRLARSMDIIRQYSGGTPVLEIAQCFDCSPHTVLRLARAANLPKRPRHFPAATRAAGKRVKRQCQSD